ncbi:MAG: UDP-N-acetylmuramoyl-L-alanyl-D-glutamate--2,6-diaminopimelate ligase [Motiliproteus sp.]
MSRFGAKMMTLSELLQPFVDEQMLQLPPPGSDRIQLSGITNDSRRIQGGDLFLACRGERFDGNAFIGRAIEAGAAAVLCDGDGAAEFQTTASAVPVLFWPELSQHAAALACHFYQQPSLAMQMIGITGTNGKTSCSHFVAQAMTELGQKTAVIGTTGNGLVDELQTATHTTPDAVELQQLLADLYQQGVAAVAMEVSSHALEQQRVAGIAFEQAIFTNLSRDHLDYHGTMEAYAEAKALLFTGSGLKQAVINTDDDFGRQLWQRLQGRVDVVAIGRRPLAGAAQLLIKSCQLTPQGIKALIDSPWGELQIDSPLLGEFNLYNLLSALAVVVGAGQSPHKALAVLNTLSGVVGRMQAFVAENQPLVVVDYAHTPDALEKALQSLRQHSRGRLWCLFGCGGDRDTGKRPLMAKVAQQHADRLMITSDNPRSEAPQQIIDQIIAGLAEPTASTIECLGDRKQAIEAVIDQAVAGDVVLIAGKGHEDYQEIDGVRHAFSDIDIVRHRLKAAVEMVPEVKCAD